MSKPLNDREIGWMQRASSAEEERDALTRRLAAARAVLADREKELLDLKGPCSNGKCRLHRAHSGPCDTSAAAIPAAGERHEYRAPSYQLMDDCIYPGCRQPEHAAVHQPAQNPDTPTPAAVEEGARPLTKADLLDMWAWAESDPVKYTEAAGRVLVLVRECRRLAGVILDHAAAGDTPTVTDTDGRAEAAWITTGAANGGNVTPPAQQPAGPTAEEAFWCDVAAEVTEALRQCGDHGLTDPAAVAGVITPIIGDTARAWADLQRSEQPAGPDVDTAAIRARLDRLAPGDLLPTSTERDLRVLCDALDARDAEIRELRAAGKSAMDLYGAMVVERDEAQEAYRGQALVARFDAETIEQQRDDARGLAAALEAELARVRDAVNVGATPALIAEILDEATDDE